MANTYVAIATVTVGAGGASSIAFSSIPQTYTDLKIVVSARANTSGGDNVSINFNSDTANNYTTRRLLTNNGTSVYSDNFSTSKIYGPELTNTSQTTNTFTNGEIYIPNYVGSSAKSVSVDTVNENNATGTIGLGIIAGLWSGTAAISTITLTSYQNGNFVQYTTATLYGIKNTV